MSGSPDDGAINILMVDDQPAKLLSYEAILSELGETLLRASSGREALEHLLRTEVAVVLIDVCMPELDGFELAAMIREHPRFEKTAIIFVSAVQITELDRVRGYAAGAVDYVPVPVIPEVLRAKVRIFAELFRKTRQLHRLNAELEKRVMERTLALQESTLKLEALNDELEERIETRTREREQALAQLFEAQKLDTLGKLTGGVAHDFNNLLAAILSSLRSLGRHIQNDSRARRLLDNAIQGAERGASLTQRLLAFARRQELKPEPIDLGALVDGMNDLLERAIGPRVRMVKGIPADLPPIIVDANQLELALLNLVVNARDAMPQGGSLTLSATAAEVPENAAVGVLSPGRYVELRLTDTGHGMDAATLQHATEPFFTTKGPGKGTGLGLSMVHGLATQLGGTMTIASKLGEGTTIDLWLPVSHLLDAVVELRNATNLASFSCDGTSWTVLVVDDDPLVSLGTVAMLEDLGHIAIAASSGKHALAMIDGDATIDLVITDHAMPEMTGVELARLVRARRPNLPIVLATGYAESAIEGSAEIDVIRLAKPYSDEDLTVAIAQAFRTLSHNDLSIGAR
jgi:signal transduction histidine kinase